MNNSLAEVHSELVSEWSEENSMKSLLENKLYDWLTTACQLIVLGFLFYFYLRVSLLSLQGLL